MLYAFLRVISFHNVLLNIIGTNAYNITQGLTGHLACFPSVRASLVAQIVKNLPAMQEAQIRFLGRERSPGEGNEYPLQYSYLGNPHGQRSLAGHNPWALRELDTTEYTRIIQDKLLLCQKRF